MKKSIGTQSYKTRRQAENTEQFRKGCKILHSCPFFILTFLPPLLVSPHFIPVIVYCFCHFGNLHCFGWYIMPKQHFVKTVLVLLLNFWESCRTSSRLLSFSLIFSHFLTSQTPSEDDNSEDEWLNPLLP